MNAPLVSLVLAAGFLATSTVAAGDTTTQPAAGPATPQELLEAFSRHVQRGEIDALLALYEPEAVFVPQPGVVLSGLPAIRQGLSPMLALSPTLETKVLEVHEAGDIALVIVDWSMRGTAPDGTAVSQNGRSADVFRRQADGSWRVLIDHP